MTCPKLVACSAENFRPPSSTTPLNFYGYQHHEDSRFCFSSALFDVRVYSEPQHFAFQPRGSLLSGVEFRTANNG